MKRIRLIKFLLVPLLLSTTVVYGVELQSTNYKITGLSVNSGGEVANSGSGNTAITSLIGGNISSDRLSSSSYKLNGALDAELSANVPLVTCFETTTDGSTSCSDSDVTPNGMVQICGGGGCYDRARFEFDNQSNPSDTLYSVQIKKSTDAFWSYVDGATFMVEDGATHDINDYISENAWEGTASSFNILGLTPRSEYQIRMTALNGDFTESSPSPIATATTAVPQISFDIDIASSSGGSSETSAPYSINFNTLSSQSINVASDLIWMDLNTNARGGTTMSINDAYTGLYSVSINSKISSADNSQIDLASVMEGYGVLKYSSTQTNLGPITFATNFDNGGDPNSNVVGGVSTSVRQLLNTSASPVNDGRASISLKTRINQGTFAASDYADSLYLTMIGSF